MRKIICLFLCICSILLANTIIFTSCNKNASGDPLQTENTTNETTADTTPNATNPEGTTPAVTTPLECVHEWIDATCIAPKTCAKCNATEGDVSKEHTFEKEFECSVCKKILVKQIITPALGHTEEILKGTAPTCTTDGLTDGKKCSTCGTVTVAQKLIVSMGHTEVSIPGRTANCTVSGLTAGAKCSVCGEITVAQTVVPAFGHSVLTVKEVVLEATCTEDGIYRLIERCIDCSAEISRQAFTVECLGHSETVFSRENVIEADCVSQGSCS